MSSMSEPITLEQLRNELAQATERFSTEMRRILQEERELSGSPLGRIRPDGNAIPGKATEQSSPLGRIRPDGDAIPGKATEQSHNSVRAFYAFPRQFSQPRLPSKRVPSTRKDALPGDASEPGRGPGSSQDVARELGLEPIASSGQYHALEIHASESAGDEQEDAWKAWIHGSNVQKVMAMVVCLNSIVMGCQVNAEVQNQPIPENVTRCDRLFACVFLVEIVLRLAIDRSDFFCSEHVKLNVLDLSLVITQIMELSMQTSAWIDVRCLRLLRLLRLSRLVRLFVVFNPLLAVCTALVHSVGALFWTLILLLMALYIASMIILHVIVHVGSVDEIVVQRWFGGMVHTMLSLFECIAGGVSWDEIVRPLFLHVSPWVGIAVVLYIVAGILFMLNLITGIFVDQVVQGACEDRDRLMVDHITELFLGDGDGVMSEQEQQRQIEREEFTAKMEHQTMQDYFKKIDLCPSQAHKLFDLIDVDGSGSVSAEEVVQGCLSLRGSARGFDAQILMRELADIRVLLNKLSMSRNAFDI